MKNIYFIEAKSPGAHIFSRTILPRLGSILLATIVRNLGYNTKVFIEDIATLAWDLLDDADMVCISSITDTANRAFQIAEKFKKRGVPVVLGGPHTTFLPDESLQYADYVIRGEGEETLVELLDNLNACRPLNLINGLSFRNSDNKIVHNSDRKLIQNLDEAPIPDFSLVHKWEEKAKVIPIATSRGCPFGCKFCSVIPMFGRKYRFKSIERVIEEIQFPAPKKKRHVFFIDDNFAANKKRTKELLKIIIERNIKFEWSAQVRTDIVKDGKKIDPELIKLMKKAGCCTLFIGFESINPETLDLYNKSQSLQDIENAIKIVKENGINIHGMFVLGSDTDDIETIKNTAKFAKKLDLESIQFMVLTPLPGTPVFDDLNSSGRLIHTDWSKYDAHHAVFEPSLMTAYELHVETLKAMGKFYSWGALIRNLGRCHFFYAAVDLYGIRSVKKALLGAKSYLKRLKKDITRSFDERTENLRKILEERKGLKIKIIAEESFEGSPEEKFLTTFLKKIGITPIVFIKKVYNGRPVEEPFVVIELPCGYKEKIIVIKPLSNFKLCEEISNLLTVKKKTLRKAYNKALRAAEGKNFEFESLMIIVK